MIGYVIYRGIRIGLRIAGTSEVQAIDGSRQLIVHIEPVMPPRGGPGLPRAA